MIQMRNPTVPQTGANAPAAGLPEDQRVKLDDEQMQETFGGAVKEDSDGKKADSGNRFGRPERMDLLDSSGVELLLIDKSAESHPEDHEVAAGDDQKKALAAVANKDAGLDDAEVLKELGASAKDVPVDPLHGDWL